MNPVGGWPFPFLRDAPYTSVVGKLGIEDEFHLRWFLADTAVIATLPAGAVLAVRRLRRRL
jgi:hypothetical protein